MTSTKFKFVTAALCVASCLFVGCGDDGGGNADEADASITIDASVEEYVCDPVGANAAMGALFNEPLAAGVEVIIKTPQHPGDPGPTDLP